EVAEGIATERRGLRDPRGLAVRDLDIVQAQAEEREDLASRWWRKTLWWLGRRDRHKVGVHPQKEPEALEGSQPEAQVHLGAHQVARDSGAIVEQEATGGPAAAHPKVSEQRVVVILGSQEDLVVADHIYRLLHTLTHYGASKQRLRSRP